MTENQDNDKNDEVEISATAAPQIDARAYFEEVPISVTIINESDRTLLIEEVALRFSGDESPISISKKCGKVVEPHLSLEEVVLVVPTPRYLANTNTFKIRVRYRELFDKGVANQREHTYSGPPSPFLIIHPCPDRLGNAFISFKQPEDRRLADIMARFAERSGFDPYMAERHPAPGTEVWARIEANLRSCASALILWTEQTTWGSGVQREVKLIQDARIPHAFIVEEGVQLPDGYNDEIEFIRFSRLYPHESFEAAVISIRDQVRKRA